MSPCSHSASQSPLIFHIHHPSVRRGDNAIRLAPAEHVPTPRGGPRGRKRYRHYIYTLAQIRPLHCTISSLALRRSAISPTFPATQLYRIHSLAPDSILYKMQPTSLQYCYQLSFQFLIFNFHEWLLTCEKRENKAIVTNHMVYMPDEVWRQDYECPHYNLPMSAQYRMYCSYEPSVSSTLNIFLVLSVALMIGSCHFARFHNGRNPRGFLQI